MDNKNEDFDTSPYLSLHKRELLGRSKIRCLQINVADKYALGLNSLEYDPDRVQADIELMFDAMDALRIRKMDENIFMDILDKSIRDDIEFVESCRKKSRSREEEIEEHLKFIRDLAKDATNITNEEINEEIENIRKILYSRQLSYIKERLERDTEEHHEFFEMGEPEAEIKCNMSCKGTIRIESIEKGTLRLKSSETLGPEITSVTYVEKAYCPFRDGLIPELIWFDGRDVKLMPLTRKLSYDELKFNRLNIGNELLHDYNSDEHEFIIIRKNK